MSRKKINLFGIAVALMIVVAGLVINTINSKAKYDILENHREMFEAVKDETERLMSNQDQRGDIGETFLYSNGGNAATDQFHDNGSASLQGKIRQIVALSEDKLSFLRYSKQDGKSIIRFVFDWERVYGDTYHIVYSESQDVVVKAYDGEPGEYVLDMLEDGWYGIRIR